MGTSGEPVNVGSNTNSSAPQGDAYERVKTTLLEFSWSNYGLDLVEDTVDDPDCQDWAKELAAETIAALA